MGSPTSARRADRASSASGILFPGFKRNPQCGNCDLSAGGLAQARKAGLKPREVEVETACGICRRKYVPGYEHDPCIADLPGVRFACCGHGKELGGYLLFENGIRIRFSGPDAINLHTGDGAAAPTPGDRRFWKQDWKDRK